MPGVALHLVIARNALERWRRAAVSLPFDPDHPDALHAFLFGALGPDLGYFPGGPRPLSDLAHGLLSGRLARTLVGLARSRSERAFAWGWVSHVLADRDIHPWIGLGVGALQGRGRACFIDGATDPLGHLRVEMGIDVWFAHRERWTRTLSLGPPDPGRLAGLTSEAYREVYRVRVSERCVRDAHRKVVRWSATALRTHALLRALRNGGRIQRRTPAITAWLRRAIESPRLRGTALAYLTPVRPESWLLRGVTSAVGRQPDALLAAVESGATDLRDHNLDTGRLIAADPVHPCTTRALRGLSALRRSAEEPARRVAVRTPGDPGGPVPAPCPGDDADFLVGAAASPDTTRGEVTLSRAEV